MSEGASPAPAAAPSQGAPEAAPVAAPEVEGTPENPVIQIKPIPPKGGRIKFAKGELPKVSPDGEAIPEDYVPRLPGVFTDDTGADEIPSLSRKRDPETGRFLKDEGAPELPEGQAPAEGQPDKPPLPEGQEPEAAPAKGKVKFLGKEYNSIGDIEQAHRTLQGMYRKGMDERRTLVEERDYGYQAGNAWKAEYDRQAQEIEGLRAQLEGRAPRHVAPQPGAAVASPPPSGVDFDVDAVVSGIDMNAFEMIATHAQGGLPNAGRYLVAETLAAVKNNLVPMLLAQIDQRLKPVEAERTSLAAQQGQMQAFDLVADMKTVDGDVAFPELSDAQAVEEIGELFGRTERRPFETAQDIIKGIAMYRLMRGFNQRPGPAPGPAPVEPTPAPGAAASLEADPLGTLPANRGRAQGSPSERRLIASLDNPNLVDPVLGFRRNQ